MKNSEGKPDGIFTLTVIAFFIVMVKFIFGGFSATIAENSFSVGQCDASDIVAILGTMMGAYIGRNYTDKKFGAVDDRGEPDPTIEKGHDE